MEYLWYENAWIYIYIEYADIGINISNIMHMIWFKILDFIAL